MVFLKFRADRGRRRHDALADNQARRERVRPQRRRSRGLLTELAPCSCPSSCSSRRRPSSRGFCSAQTLTSRFPAGSRFSSSRARARSGSRPRQPSWSAPGVGARNGILVKTAAALEIAHSVDTVVLDKTGTVTAGRPTVTDIHSVCELDDNDLLALAASIETPSEHPLAFRNNHGGREVGSKDGRPSRRSRRTPERASRRPIRGKRYFAGGPGLLKENGIRRMSSNRSSLGRRQRKDALLLRHWW